MSAVLTLYEKDSHNSDLAQCSGKRYIPTCIYVAYKYVRAQQIYANIFIVYTYAEDNSCSLLTADSPQGYYQSDDAWRGGRGAPFLAIELFLG